jgi:serine/threonine protein kinase
MEYESPETVPAEWQVGDVILNRYEVRQKFEGGGMGMVYRVYHREWDMELAVKAPRADFFQTTEQKENFEREAETWVNLGLHPHIASCYYVRRLGGIPRLFAEFVEGGTLNEWISDGRLYQGDPNSRTLRVLDTAIQVAWALSYAHKKGLVHQDVKPANILMMPDGTAKLTDFGLARARLNLASTATSSSTLPGRTVWVEGAGLLTPEYAAPEQFKGDQVSSHTDGWSWALTVLEMMQGERGWADGRFGPEALSAHYQDRLEVDPVGRILEKHLTPNRPERSGSLETAADLLIDVYNSISSISYNRPRPNEGGPGFTSDDLNNRGVALLELGQQEKAKQFLWDAYALDDRNPHVVFNLEVANWRGLFWPASTDLEVIDHLLRIRDESNSSTIAYLLSQLAKERGFPQKYLDGVMPSRDQMVAGLREIAQIQSHNEVDAPSLLVLKTTHCAKGTIKQRDPQILGLDCNGTLHKWSLEGVLQHSVPLISVECPSGFTSVFRGGIFTEDLRWLITTEKVTEGMERDAPSAIHVSVHDAIDGKRMSSQLAHKARNGSYYSFWDQPGLNCFHLLDNDLLVTVGHNDLMLKVWTVPELALVAEIILPTQVGPTNSRLSTEQASASPIILGQFESNGISYTVELICWWPDIDRGIVIHQIFKPLLDSDFQEISEAPNAKLAALFMNEHGRAFWMAPDRKSCWKNQRDYDKSSIWGRSSVDKKFYLERVHLDRRIIYFTSHCDLYAKAAFTQNSDYLVFCRRRLFTHEW